MDLAPLARIIVRYAAGALVMKGLIPSETGSQLAVDPDVIKYVDLGLGVGLGAVSEIWYWAAKRFGWQR